MTEPATVLTLPVNEIFETIQGEAHWTGTPSVFLRLQGCDVGCPWCDTRGTWLVDPENEVDAEQMAVKVKDSPTWARCSVGELMSYIVRMKSRHVVVTGGEPCSYDLRRLTRDLHEVGKMVQVETSGTYPVQVDPRTWVTLSPKIDMPGGRVVRQDAIERANEIKMPVGKPDDIRKLDALLGVRTLSMPYPASHIWLQPLSQSDKATELCIETARQRGWRLSVQVHKYMHVR